MDAPARRTSPEPLRVPLSALKANPGGYLETAHQRRVLLTRRGKVVGELVPRNQPSVSPVKPLHGALKELVALSSDADLTAPVDAEWEALD